MVDARRLALRGSLALAALAALLLVLWLAPLPWRVDAGLERALTERGRVAVLGSQALLGLHAQGASLVDAHADAALAGALAASDANALALALERAHYDALLVEPKLDKATPALASRIAHYQHVAGLRGLYLSRAAALYAPDETRELSQPLRDALAVVARALIGGARPPMVGSFPLPLRRLRPVEVMVLLREGTQPRLWRSARGSSIASALITAATVARQRWQEREQAMGTPLDKALPRLDVEVALLDDDGTIGDRDPAFIDRVFFLGVHGVGYERKGAWRYLLPDATREDGKGKPSKAYRKLFGDDGLPQDSFGRHELRLYRLVVQTIATSPAPPRKDDGLSPVRSPEDVLGKTAP